MENSMSNNKDLLTWINDNLSDILSFPVPPDLSQYILTIQDDRDLEDYLKTLLDFSNPKTKAFIEKYKVMRYYSENKERNDDYFTVKDNNNKKNNNNKKGNAEPSKVKEVEANNSEESTGPECKGAKPKTRTKFVNLYSAEGQSKDVVFLKGRHWCECQASKHKLINNCLKCGRVVCAQEGSGPCFFCGSLVCSTQEQEILNANTKKSKKLFEALTKTGSSDGLSKALEQRNRLLEYDITSQQRSKVIDDESDYFTSNSTWLTKEERERMQKKEEKAHALKHMPRSQRKFTLDFAGRRVLEEEVEEEELDESLYADAYDKIEENLAKSHANPDFPLNIQPMFIEGITNNDYPALDVKLESDSRTLVHKVQDKELLLIADSGACLSMHQPWASLLVSGIKKHEGRTWYTSHRGRLWIAAASKPPTEENIKDCEAFYRAITGDDRLPFPKSYPTSCLLGCVSVIDCLPQEEYRLNYPDGESESPFVFICEDPIELDVRFPISGSHKIYKLDSRIHQAARKSLLRVAKQQNPKASR